MLAAQLNSRKARPHDPRPRPPIAVTYRHEPLDSAKPLNPRQELFAQALARGMSAKAACRAAGYRNVTGFHRLSQFPNVKARVAQLLADAAARSVITTDHISDYLLDLIERSKSGDAAPIMQLNRAAVMDLAKIHGLLDAKGQPTKPKGQGVCTCGGANRITVIRRVVVEPDGREWEY
jgi:hypothetical protein